MYNWKIPHYRNKETLFPQVIAIFSAAKYSDSYNNKGAIIKFEVILVNSYFYIQYKIKEYGWSYIYQFIRSLI